ncbi:MAG: Crp/Fnr family transcriptional regulator [Steroidobacteraceae bacterium]
MRQTILIDYLIRQLALRDSSLLPASRDLLLSAFSAVSVVKADHDIVPQGSRPDRCTLIVAGWACRYAELSDGRRQTLAVHVSGDFVDLHSFPLKRMDHAVAALTDCTIQTIPHTRMRYITETDPHLTRVLWLHTLVDAAMLRQWLLSAGQRNALERTAHLLCELFSRLQIVGLASPNRPFDLPLTQADLAAALGISAVHVNRMIAQLRTRELFHWHAREARILDWERLRELAKFDPAYLILTDEPR